MYDDVFYDQMEVFCQAFYDIQDNLKYEYERYITLLSGIDDFLSDMKKSSDVMLLRKHVKDASSQAQTILYYRNHVNLVHWKRNGADTHVYYINSEGAFVGERYINRIAEISLYVMDNRRVFGWILNISKSFRRQMINDSI
jgi:hypothetical protein